MAYEAHKWKIGEEITSDKLNHIEKGIEEAGLPREITDPQDGQTLKYDAASGKWVNGEGGGSGRLIVNVTTNGSITTLDKTWQEIADAYPNVCAIGYDSGNFIYYLPVVGYEDGEYKVFIDTNAYTTSSATGYPSHSEEDLG